ncbi:MAG TPA: hypothetical protein VHJ19_12165 [Gammaproteobacteria bacterium]|nr:hypothetical protein [Gammaproteobacteria bacterium]
MWKLALIYPALRSGRHGMWKEVRAMSGTEVRIRTRRPRAVNTDGELSTHAPARVRVLPKAIVVLASRPAPTKPVQAD